MKITTKQLLIIVAVVIVIFIAIGFWFYRKGRKKVTAVKPPLDNPNTGGNNTAGVSNAEILSISDALFTDMDGYNWSGHDVMPYQRLQALSDTDFVNVYNVFNSKYQPESGETLKQWINSEMYAFDDVIESILDRMARLNLI